MKTYLVRLLEKKEIAQETMAFTFEKPKDFTFKAGQCGDFTLLHPKETDEEGNIRCFSFASAPYEEGLMIATRMRDTAFKRCLHSLPLGSELKLEAPNGSFTLHTKATTPAVFLTGGVGITPVRSIVLQATHDTLPHRIFLFYSNKTPETAAFLQELSDLEKTSSRYTFIATMTEKSQSRSKWMGHVGYIDTELLRQHINDLSAPIYYICGPRGMVTAMGQCLRDAGVNEDNIRTEEFSGY
jgi:ferredoxin-NADP reductase